MSRRWILRRSLLQCVAFTALFAGASMCWAQLDADGGGGDNPNTAGAFGTSGVAIDAEGVLRRQVYNDPTGALNRRRFAEAKAALNREVAKPSKLRKISLNRLEAALGELIREGRRPNPEMKYLAGLTRIQYVFYYPETRDIVIAGPAGGWGENLLGKVVGLDSGKPVLLLEDLIVALRAYPPNGKQVGSVFCSIDPTQEGLQKMQAFLRKIGGRATPRDTQFIVKGLQDSLGVQKITVGGVSPKTNLAQVMVEADYRMKLIGIGLERPAVKLTSYVARANPASVSRNAMQRWYFVPDYECVKVADDHFAMQLVGDGVKLVGENEVVTKDGTRAAAARGSRASELFVKEFTRKYPELASRSPIYAQLRNVIDLLVASAFIQREDYYGKAGWSMDVFRNEDAYQVHTHNAPKEVASAVNSLWKGNRLMTPIGGGVMIQASRALQSGTVLEDEDGKVAGVRKSVSLKNLKPGTWWWD